MNKTEKKCNHKDYNYKFLEKNDYLLLPSSIERVCKNCRIVQAVDFVDASQETFKKIYNLLK